LTIFSALLTVAPKKANAVLFATFIAVTVTFVALTIGAFSGIVEAPNRPADIGGSAWRVSQGVNRSLAKETAMTTLPDRPNTALVVIDVQNGVVAEAYQPDSVVANIDTLVGTARDEGVPIVWVQHSDDGLERGSEAWQYMPELTRLETEPRVH
jgi:hypothetical protein